MQFIVRLVLAIIDFDIEYVMSIVYSLFKISSRTPTNDVQDSFF